MTQTITHQQTQTYTVADVSKTFESFESNLRLFSRSSGVEEELVSGRAADVIAVARAKYLRSVAVILRDAVGERLRAAKFTVCEDASGWKVDMPGDNLWPRTPGGSICIILTYNDEWWGLSEAQRQNFKSKLTLHWGPTNEDTSFADMDDEGSRRYASNAYGLHHNSFRRRP